MEMFLQHKYAKRGIDVVMAIGDHQLEYVLKRRKTLLPDAKLIYLTLGRLPRQPIPGATGMAWEFNLGPTLEVALLQNPATRHVLLVAGATALDRGVAQLFLLSGQKYLQAKHSDVDLQVISPGTIDETMPSLQQCRRIQSDLCPLLRRFGGTGLCPGSDLAEVFRDCEPANVLVD